MSVVAEKLQWVHGQITVVMPLPVEDLFIHPLLQWVHGQITVVMNTRVNAANVAYTLQWVHGQITVVMSPNRNHQGGGRQASMGPRSDNRGYENLEERVNKKIKASMGPRSDNRGYGSSPLLSTDSWRRFNGSTVR